MGYSSPVVGVPFPCACLLCPAIAGEVAQRTTGAGISARRP